MGPKLVNCSILTGFQCFILGSDAVQLCFRCSLAFSASLFGIPKLALMLGAKDPRFLGDPHGLI